MVTTQMTGRKRALAILAIAVAVSLFGASARGGHAPVSDILVNQNLFLPSEPEVCPQLATALTKQTDQVAKEGYPLKVAIMGSRADLGRAPQYFGRPQEYARFLGSEIGIYRPGGPVQTNESLLIVMPAGFGYVRSGKAANVSLVLIGLEAPKGEHPNDLARAAIGAVRELASAAGHPVPAPKISSGCAGGGGSSAIVYVVPIGLVLLAAAVITLVARQRASRGSLAERPPQG
jgi:hypothetical protein